MLPEPDGPGVLRPGGKDGLILAFTCESDAFGVTAGVAAEVVGGWILTKVSAWANARSQKRNSLN